MDGRTSARGPGSPCPRPGRPRCAAAPRPPESGDVAARDPFAERHDVRAPPRTARSPTRCRSGRRRVSTSSATNSTSWRSQISRTVRKYSGGGTEAPVDEPPTGSARKAATVSAPASRIAASSASRCRSDRRHRSRRRRSGKRRNGDTDHVHQPVAEQPLVVPPRGGREREQRVAVIGGRERDDAMFRRPAALHPVLPGELERRLDRLRAAREEVDLIEIAGQRRRELGGQLLDRGGGERRPVHVGDAAAPGRRRPPRSPHCRGPATPRRRRPPRRGTACRSVSVSQHPSPLTISGNGRVSLR